MILYHIMTTAFRYGSSVSSVSHITKNNLYYSSYIATVSCDLSMWTWIPEMDLSYLKWYKKVLVEVAILIPLYQA